MAWINAWDEIRRRRRCHAMSVGYFHNGFWRWLETADEYEAFNITDRWLTPLCLILKTTDPLVPYWWIWRDACHEHTFRQLSLWSRDG